MLQRVRSVRTLLLASLSLIIVACGTPAQISSLPATFSIGTARPFPTATTAAQQSGQQSGQQGNSVTAVAVAPTVTNTPIPPTESPTLIPPSATPTFRPIATATRVVTAVPGDPARGKVWFENGNGVASVPTCLSCHNVVDDGTVKTGPLMTGIGSRSGTGERGPDAWAYIHTSITNPNAYILPNEGSKIYKAGGVSLMYQNYATDLTPAQIDDLTAYLLTLK